MNTEQRFDRAPDIEITSLSSNKNARVIMVNNGQNGEGKSSLTINLAVELAHLNQQVCVLDADTNPESTNLYTSLTPLYTLHDVLGGNKLLEHVMFNGPAGISIIPAASAVVEGVDDDPAQQQSMIDIIQRLESGFDYVLIDTGSEINESVLSFIETVPETVITITTEPSSVKDAFVLLQALARRGFDRPLRLVVKRVKNPGVAEFTMHLFANMVKLYLGLDISSSNYIVEDQNLSGSNSLLLPYVLLYPDTPTTRCIRNFARDLIEAKHYLPQKLSNRLGQDMASNPEPAVNTETEPDQNLVVETIEEQRLTKPWVTSNDLAAIAEVTQIQQQDTGAEIQLDDTSMDQPVDDDHSVPVSEPEQMLEPDADSQQQPFSPADSATTDRVDYLTAIHFASQLSQPQLDK
ncbi:MAG: AAA family ATPase [Gammaproteobacteria bacterium]|nr:AAA family ATPase [Gammaproteobacteria bacterium]